MKKIAIAALLSAFVAAPAFAVNGKNSVGINFGTDMGGVFGIQGEFDISSMTNNAPVSVQAFWKGYSQSYTYCCGLGTYKWSYNGFGAAAIYDFSAVAKLDKKIHPYAGLGLYTLSASFSGTGGTAIAADTGGLYITGGVRYSLTPQVDADLNYNNIGGITIGGNFSF